ncbi:tetrapyrrole methylase [Schizopora paradoxa]|uniref:precorrin-2 dehydrogenase n=1 Tax=Schizopora paradoxa TaxID=27342 RepID=A0A0H2S4L1_9AGAM|nr:tetrapyrrole methylase [Schizopora paradoxa]
MASSYPSPQRGASMMLAFRMSDKLTVIIGAGRLAASRAFHALEADSRVIILCRGGVDGDACCDELRWRARNGEVEVRELDGGLSDEDEAGVIEKFLAQHQPISFVCVTDTLVCGNFTTRRSRASAKAIHQACQRMNIPVNVSDMPDLCDFTFCATHRFRHHENTSDGGKASASPLQIAVTTNGEGCRLAGRLKRELVAKMPNEVGLAVENVGRLRALAKARWNSRADESRADFDLIESELNDEMLVPSPNGAVRQRGVAGYFESDEESARRRLKWVAQISEFWSIERLAELTEVKITHLLEDALVSPDVTNDGGVTSTSQHGLTIRRTESQSTLGKVFLVGSGTGHPSFLTVAAHKLLTSKSTDLILTDKLVPAGVLNLIPRDKEVRVARKFPGNAEGAQTELMEMAVAAAREGKNVVRLKQGDPMVYGRAGEEILYFRSQGITTHVIPGLSAAFAAPLCAGIPVTQRGVAEGVVVCTGVGRGGKGVRLPGYDRARTVVILMGVARLAAVVQAMISGDGGERGRDGAAYPPYTPIAIIERASMPDQRVVSSTLENVAEALESTGEQRPPGLMVVGWAVSSLCEHGEIDVLPTVDQTIDAQTEIEGDKARITRWLKGGKWRVSEGFDSRAFDKHLDFTP